MPFELGYDFDEAIERQKLSLKDIAALRDSIGSFAPKDLTDKQVYK